MINYWIDQSRFRERIELYFSSSLFMIILDYLSSYTLPVLSLSMYWFSLSYCSLTCLYFIVPTIIINVIATGMVMPKIKSMFTPPTSSSSYSGTNPLAVIVAELTDIPPTVDPCKEEVN